MAFLLSYLPVDQHLVCFKKRSRLVYKHWLYTPLKLLCMTHIASGSYTYINSIERINDCHANYALCLCEQRI